MQLKIGYNECNNEEYHGDRSFYSSSALKMILQDKAAFYKKYILNEKTEEKINHNFVFGSYIHTLLLEPHLVEEEFACFSGSKGSKEHGEFLKQNKGKQILTPNAWKNGQFIRQVCVESPHHVYIEGGEAEKTLCGKLNGVPIKVRADYVTDSYILDIKTTSMAIDDIKNVERACANYGYALSAALYFDMFKRKNKNLKRFLFWFINKQSANSIMVEASDEFMEYGRRRYKKAIQILKEAMETGNWEDDLPKIYPKF